MIIKRVKLLLFFTVLALSLLSTTAVFATQIMTATDTYGGSEESKFLSQAEADKVVSRIEIVSVTKTDKTIATFKYRIFNKYGLLITKEIPASQLVAVFYGTSITLDPLTQTGTITITSLSDIDRSRVMVLVDTKTRIATTIGADEILGSANVSVEPSAPVDKSMDSKIYQIVFTSTNLMKTGEATATFYYQALNWLGTDITKTIPTDQITATTSVGSKIVLDPLTETGTITYNTSDIGKATKITLADKVTGQTAVLNTNNSEDSEQVGNSDTLIVSKLYFSSTNLIKTGEKTATFNYKVLDNYYSNITNKIPASDIVATALVGSLKADVSLDQSTGTGTITYNFAKDDKSVMVTLSHKTGVGATSALNICDLDSQSVNDDSSVSQIAFVLTDLIDTGANTQINYQIINKYGKDITNKVLASQIAIDASVNSMINLDSSTGTCNIKYDTFNTNKIILIKLTDKITGVAASANIGFTKSWKQDLLKVVNQIAISSSNLTKIGMNTVLFNYKILTQNGTDITQGIPVSQISATTSVNASISFNPLAGIGTIIYNSSSDMDKPIVITLADKVTGIKVSSTFNIANSGTSNVTESPKISNINITTDKLAISSTGIGYATYNITDQYGNDVTSSPLANSVMFGNDVSKVKGNNGLLTITPNPSTNLSTFTSIVISAHDSATGVSTSATLIVVPMFQQKP